MPARAHRTKPPEANRGGQCATLRGSSPRAWQGVFLDEGHLYQSFLQNIWNMLSESQSDGVSKGVRSTMNARFSFDRDEADPMILKRRIEASLAKATVQQLRQIYGHVRQVLEP